ncbi:MAG TPA: sulfurtransferase [Candidatus Limnocylindrales bacterium]
MNAASAPGASPLLSVAALAEGLSDPNTVIVDVRWQLGEPGAGRRAYAASHLPGAIFLDLDTDLADLGGYGAPGRHPLPSPADFAARLAFAGIGDESFVVGYDDVGGWVAARLWWMLDNLGHRGGAAVLDGGWQAWLAAGLPTTTEVARRPPAARPPRLRAAWTHVIQREALRSRLGELVLLDARAAPRYRGETEPIDPYPGHIPTAISAPWEGNVGPDGRLLPRDSLRDHFAALGAGADASGEVVAYCGSGVTATHHALARRVAGLSDPTIYVGSYSDWSRSGLPVATGPDPGAAEIARSDRS